MSLTGFLLKAHVSPLGVLTAEMRAHATPYSWDGATLTELLDDSDVSPEIEYIVTVITRVAGPGTWERFVVDSFAPPGFTPTVGQSLGALILIRVNEPNESKATRWIGWAFGTASRGIQRRSVESRFGLFAALNRLSRADEVGLRQLEYRSFGAYRQRTGHTAGRDTPLDGFRIDRVIDLLSGVGGRAGEDGGDQIYGGRSLRLRVSVSGPGDLKPLADTALRDFVAADYRDQFAFIDDFVPVDDEAKLASLRDKLTELIAAKSDRVDAVVPDDLVDYEDPRAIQFIALPRERSEKAALVTLTVSNLVQAIGDDGAAGLDHSIRFLDSDHKEIASVSVLGCTAADFEHGDGRYVVSDGEFYRVKPAFVDQIDNAVSVITSSGLPLPQYTKGRESQWIAAVAENQRDFTSVDGQLIRVEGETGFEAADLIHSSGVLIHAKRKGRSSALSYAMVQAKRSSQMLSSVPSARDKLYALITKHASSKDVAARTVTALKKLESTPPTLDVALVFLGQAPKRGLQGLPLLAKLELAETRRQIEQLGFRLHAEHVAF